MLSPYFFVTELRDSKFANTRRVMAEFALNLYYGESAMPFDLSRLTRLCNFDRVACLAALSWVSAHSDALGDRRFPKEEQGYLDSRTREALEALAGVERRVV